jgi:hypothetical protein
MSSAFRRRFRDLCAPRSDRSVAVRRRRRNDRFEALGFGEQLEQRAMLAGVTATYVADYLSTGGTGATDNPFTYTNLDKGVLVLTIDAAGVGGDDVFLRVVNGTYQFATDVSFSNLIRSMNTNYVESGLLTRTFAVPPPTPPATTPAAAPPTFTEYNAAFDTIYVRTNGLTDGVDSPSFTIIGSSQDVTKSVIVDLTDDSGNPLSNSYVSIGAPLRVSAASGGGTIGNRGAAATSPETTGGAIYLQAESITISAAVASQNDLTLISQIGQENLDNGVVPGGLTVSQAVAVPGDVAVTVSGTSFSVNAGGSIGNGANASGSFTLDLQDADARIAGKINATDQSYFLQASAGIPAAAVAHTITTRSASTGVQAGTISGNQVLIYLANKAAAGPDGSVDLQMAANNLRITSSADTLASTLDYGIKITNSKALLVDSVAASQGDISLTTTSGTITLQAAIDTLGGFSLSSGDNLTVDSSITSAAGVSLASTAGSVTTNAAILANEGATSQGQVTISAKTDVTINSLVRADQEGISVTATTGKITSGANLLADPTSRITGSSAALRAATGITLGTNVDVVTASVTGTGDLSIDDNGAGLAAFTVASAKTNAGNVSIKSVRSVGVASAVAGGAGDVSITSTEGDIDLGTVIADGDAVTLAAVEFGTDGTTVLSAGVISGFAPVAGEISWTANAVVDAEGNESTALYRNIPTISAYRLSAGDIDFTADNAVTLKSIKTTDGSVNVVSTLGGITATSIEAVSDVNVGGVTLDGQGGSVVLGAVVAAVNGSVSVTAAQSILDDGDAATTSITANEIKLYAASSGVSGTVGASSAFVSVSSLGAGESVELLIASADTETYANAVDATSVFVESLSPLNASSVSAIDSVEMRSTGAGSGIVVGSIAVSDADGQVAISSAGNLTVGVVQVANGDFSEQSSISLSAAKYLVNATIAPEDTVLSAYSLSLSAETLDGSFDVTNIDDVSRVSATATGSKGVVSLAFNRPDALTLSGITTTGGNIVVSNAGAGDLQIGAAGIKAGTTVSGNTVTLTTGGAISEPEDESEGVGTISAGSVVTLNATNDISVVTSAGQLAATSTAGSVEIVQTGNVKIAAAGLNATTPGSSVTLSVTGAIQSGTGSITSDTAIVSATNGLDIRTDVGALSAIATNGAVTVLEADGLTVDPLGISAKNGAVSLTLTAGGLDGAGQVISGNSVAIKLLQADNSIDIDTSTSTVTASTADGDITIRNDKSLAVGAAGIVTGVPATNNVSLEVAAGSITASAGTIKANQLALNATTGITAKTSVSDILADTTSGNISLTQSGKAVTLSSVVAGNGGVTVVNNDDITVTSVQAIGASRNVSIEATGTNKSITFGTNSIFAEGDTVTLKSTGGLDGTSVGAEADITASSIVLTSSGGDVTATVRSNTVTATALGTDTGTKAKSAVDLTILGTRTVMLGTTSGVNLTAAGDVTLHADPNNIVVVKAPTAGGTTTYDTSGVVTFAVSTTAATGSGSLSQALTDASGATVIGGGSAGVAFTTSIGSPIQLRSTVNVGSPITLDGTVRVNTTTGTLSTGRQIDIDGSRLVTGTAGFKFGAGSDNSVVRGFAFYGFNKAGGAGVETVVGADNVTISNNLFGISSTGRISSNRFGILAAGDGAVITGNTVVKSTDTGIQITGDKTQVTGNLIGTNATRQNLSNTTGIKLNAAGEGNTIGGTTAADANVVSFNTVAGIHVAGTDASAGTETTIRGNEVLLNKTGILIDGATKNAVVAGNTVTRNTGDGILVNGSSSDITIGGDTTADPSVRNYVGTTSRNSLGLGNQLNGIAISSSGSGIAVEGNTVLGNGAANSAGNNAGVKLSGANANDLSVTGNVITANRGAGILSGRTGAGVVTIQKNTISSNSGSGVQVSSGKVVVGGTYAATNEDLRANANTINSNAAYGVQVLAGAFAQIAGNSMAGNRLAGILNPGLSAPTITAATRSASTGTLTVNFSGLASGQVVHVYAGTPDGRTYLGKFTATGATGAFTMTLAAQQAAGVQASVFAGAIITGTRTSVGAGTEQTSPFAAARTATRVA